MTKEKLRVPARVRRFADQIASDYGRRPPRIEYVVGRGGGWARPAQNLVHFAAARRDGRRVEAAIDWKEMRSLIAHEMAHLVTNHHHSRKFWRVYWEMVKRYRIDYAIALQRTATYKVDGVVEAAHAEIPGAQELLDAHQRQLNRGLPGFLGGGEHRHLYAAEQVRAPGEVVQRRRRMIAGPLRRRDRATFDPFDSRYRWEEYDDVSYRHHWEVLSKCVGLRWVDRPCGAYLYTSVRTEGQARRLAAELHREP